MVQQKTANFLDDYVRAAQVEEVKVAGSLLVRLKHHTIALFYCDSRIYAIDNRCPHMGFPLHGSICQDGVVVCPWHYARFDLLTGGTYDSWADDVRAFPVEIREGEVWVNLAPQMEAKQHQRQRLEDGLKQGISLVIAKSVIALLNLGVSPQEPFAIALRFGTYYNSDGWDTGLSILTCLMNILPYLDKEDQPLALYQGLSAVARDCANKPPRFGVHPLPYSYKETDELDSIERLKRWFRQFIELRNGEAAERCLVSAIAAGATPEQIADILFSAATDHLYLDGGHLLDFINKALEALDSINWDKPETVLSSLVSGLAEATRMEESNSWRSPIDLGGMLKIAYEQLPKALETGKEGQSKWRDNGELVSIILGDDPQKIVDAFLEALRAGCTGEQLAAVVTYSSALRVARFHTNNDFSDWDSAHHSFTYSHAVHQAIKRVNSLELIRGVFDAGMSVYLNRFLSIPPARLPEAKAILNTPEELLKQLPELLDRQQQVNEAGQLVVSYLHHGGEPKQLMAMLGKLMLRENRDFHVIQSIEAAFTEYAYLGDTPAGVHVLVAAARYLAAHSPTRRTQSQTYQIADRLHRGDCLFEE